MTVKIGRGVRSPNNPLFKEDQPASVSVMAEVAKPNTQNAARVTVDPQVRQRMIESGQIVPGGRR